MNLRHLLRENPSFIRLLQYRATCVDTSREILERAIHDGRGLKDDERQQVDELVAEAQQTTVEIDRRQADAAAAGTDAASYAEAMRQQSQTVFGRTF